MNKYFQYLMKIIRPNNELLHTNCLKLNSLSFVKEFPSIKKQVLYYSLEVRIL